MNASLKPFFTKSFIFTIIIGALTIGLKYSGLSPQIYNQWYWILLFFCIFTLFIFQKLLKTLGKDPRKFFTTFLSISIFRMLLFTAVILVYAFLINRNDVQTSISFIITFAVYYLIFTTWELVMIVPAMKKKSNK